MLFMLPSDQARLRECMMRTSLLDELLGCLEEHRHADWFQRNARAYLEVCELFGRSAAQHHDSLVKRFIEGPSAALDEHGLEGITASGPPLPVLLRSPNRLSSRNSQARNGRPPLPVLLRSLETLRDLRLAADRPDIGTRHADLELLRRALGS